MMNFLAGGLVPIVSRYVLDAVAILGLGYSIFTEASGVIWQSPLATIVPVTLFTAGLTSRWMLTFPMIPLVVLQSLRYFFAFDTKIKWLSVIVRIVSTLLLLLALFLCLAFPAMQLPSIDGPYRVGVVEFHMPVRFDSVYSNHYPDTHNNNTSLDDDNGYVAVKILYPTLDGPEKSLPYLRTDTHDEYLDISMKTAAPPPLNQLTFMLHNWKLIRMRAKPYAKPLYRKERLPLMTYSHGLGGTSHLYSYQTFSMAAKGYVVVAIDHTDRTAPVVKKHDGTTVLLNHEIVQLWNDGKVMEYVEYRRGQTDHRAKEMLAASLALKRLNVENVGWLEERGVSFVGRLQTDQHHFVGHSFGGVTALAAGLRRPDLATSIVAHEPALDWAPDDVRRAVLPQEIVGKSPIATDGGTGGWGSEERKTKAQITDVNTLIMFSEEWYTKKWAFSHQLEWMHQNKLVKGLEFAVIAAMKHNEFSDMCMLTPLWLARGVGVTGERNPIDTAREVHDRTRVFLDKQH